MTTLFDQITAHRRAARTAAVPRRRTHAPSRIRGAEQTNKPTLWLRPQPRCSPQREHRRPTGLGHRQVMWIARGRLRRFLSSLCLQLRAAYPWRAAFTRPPVAG